jgi:hypothetical protein
MSITDPKKSALRESGDDKHRQLGLPLIDRRRLGVLHRMDDRDVTNMKTWTNEPVGLANLAQTRMSEMSTAPVQTIIYRDVQLFAESQLG